MRKFSIAFIFSLSLLFSSNASAQSDSLLKTNDIRILLNLMDVGPAMQRSLIDEIEAGRKNQEEGLPAKFWDEFEKEALANVSDFLERLIPVYDSEFTHAEIKSLIKIYQDPVMRKMNIVEPRLSEAAGRAGEAWGEELGLKVAIRLDAETETKPDATPAQDNPRRDKKL